MMSFEALLHLQGNTIDAEEIFDLLVRLVVHTPDTLDGDKKSLANAVNSLLNVFNAVLGDDEEQTKYVCCANPEKEAYKLYNETYAKTRKISYDNACEATLVPKWVFLPNVPKKLIRIAAQCEAHQDNARMNYYKEHFAKEKKNHEKASDL